MKTISKAEIISAVICVLFVAAVFGFKLLPRGEAGFAVQDSLPVVTTEPVETHYKDGKLMLNSATETELAELPGIGDVLAARITAYREENGGFSSIDELANVYGIGETLISGIADYVTVEDENEDTGS